MVWTYCYTGGHQVRLVDDKDQVLMRCLFPEVFFNAPTPSAEGVSGVENMENDICDSQ
jgi:hypothetical protein